MRPPRLRRWPWDPVDLEQREAGALRAVRDGTADAYQQRLAWRTIVEKFANVQGMSFTVGLGPDGDRATAFAEGRRWLGRMLESPSLHEAPLRPDIRGEPPPVPRDDIEIELEPEPLPTDEGGSSASDESAPEPEPSAMFLANPFDEVEEVTA
jgi:hypothetical protein